MMGYIEQLIVFLLFLSGAAAIIAGIDTLYQYGYEVWWRIKRARARRQAERQAPVRAQARLSGTGRRCSRPRRPARCPPRSRERTLTIIYN